VFRIRVRFFFPHQHRRFGIALSKTSELRVLDTLMLFTLPKSSTLCFCDLTRPPASLLTAFWGQIEMPASFSSEFLLNSRIDRPFLLAFFLNQVTGSSGSLPGEDRQSARRDQLNSRTPSVIYLFTP